MQFDDGLGAARRMPATCTCEQCHWKTLLREEQDRSAKLVAANNVLRETQQYLVDKCSAMNHAMTAQVAELEAQLRETRPSNEHLKELRIALEAQAQLATKLELRQQEVQHLRGELDEGRRVNAALLDQVETLQGTLEAVLQREEERQDVVRRATEGAPQAVVRSNSQPLITASARDVQEALFGVTPEGRSDALRRLSPDVAASPPPVHAYDAVRPMIDALQHLEHAVQVDGQEPYLPPPGLEAARATDAAGLHDIIAQLNDRVIALDRDNRELQHQVSRVRSAAVEAHHSAAAADAEAASKWRERVGEVVQASDTWRDRALHDAANAASTSARRAVASVADEAPASPPGYLPPQQNRTVTKSWGQPKTAAPHVGVASRTTTVFDDTSAFDFERGITTRRWSQPNGEQPPVVPAEPREPPRGDTRRDFPVAVEQRSAAASQAESPPSPRRTSLLTDDLRRPADVAAALRAGGPAASLSAAATTKVSAPAPTTHAPVGDAASPGRTAEPKPPLKLPAAPTCAAAVAAPADPDDTSAVSSSDRVGPPSAAASPSPPAKLPLKLPAASAQLPATPSSAALRDSHATDDMPELPAAPASPSTGAESSPATREKNHGMPEGVGEGVCERGVSPTAAAPAKLPLKLPGAGTAKLPLKLPMSASAGAPAKLPLKLPGTAVASAPIATPTQEADAIAATPDDAAAQTPPAPSAATPPAKLPLKLPGQPASASPAKLPLKLPAPSASGAAPAKLPLKLPGSGTTGAAPAKLPLKLPSSASGPAPAKLPLKLPNSH